MQPEKALKIVAGMCSNKEHCCQDIREKLAKWEIPEEETERIIAFLYKNNFLNDQRFATAYARDKFRFNKWGKLKIQLMLRQKGIADNTISEALATLILDDYRHTCTELLYHKLKTIKDTDPLKRKNKLIRFAVGRGFDYDTILHSLEKLDFSPENE